MSEKIRIVTDERSYNQRGGPNKLHKVRVIMGTKINPIAYGVTMPKNIAQQFSGCKLKIHISGPCIVMEKQEVKE